MHRHEERPGWNARVARRLREHREWVMLLGLIGLLCTCVDRAQPEPAVLTEATVGVEVKSLISWFLPRWYDVLVVMLCVVGAMFFGSKAAQLEQLVQRGGPNCCGNCICMFFLLFLSLSCLALGGIYSILKVLYGLVRWALSRSFLKILAINHSNLGLALVYLLFLVLMRLLILGAVHYAGHLVGNNSDRLVKSRVKAVGRIWERWMFALCLGWATCALLQVLPSPIGSEALGAAAPWLMMGGMFPQQLMIAIHELVPFEWARPVARAQFILLVTTLGGVFWAYLSLQRGIVEGILSRVFTGFVAGATIAVGEVCIPLLAMRTHQFVVLGLKSEIAKIQLQRERSGQNLEGKASFCTICKIATADALNMPCGHVFLCFTCAIKFHEHEGAAICNACRQPSRLTHTNKTQLTSSPTVLRSSDSTSAWDLGWGLISTRRAQAAERAQRQKLLCVGCGERADAVNMPCGHARHCYNCVEDWRSANGKQCPECGLESSIQKMVTVQTCDICGDETAGSNLMATPGCAHQICSNCSVSYVRNALGNVADEVKPQGVRCPHFRTSMTQCKGFIDSSVAERLVGRRSSLEPDGEAFSAEEAERLKRFMKEAAIPLAHRFNCVNATCARLLDVNLREILKKEEPKIKCEYCEVAQCVRCKILWHGALTCKEVKSMAASADAKHDMDSQAEAIIAATTKQCPKCSFRISHYHGHACHHIRPGTGCLNCGHHFCYSCLRDGTSCIRCRVYCSMENLQQNIVQHPFPRDKRCGCPICPDCRPRRPCAQCDGTCAVCRGIVPPGVMSELNETSPVGDSGAIGARLRSLGGWLGASGALVARRLRRAG